MNPKKDKKLTDKPFYCEDAAKKALAKMGEQHGVWKAIEKNFSIGSEYVGIAIREAIDQAFEAGRAAAVDEILERMGKHKEEHITAEELIEAGRKAERERILETFPELREKLAALEHKQWIIWSQNIAYCEGISQERRARWYKLWKVPYVNLSEKQKGMDRIWADKVLKEIEKLIKGEK